MSETGQLIMWIGVDVILFSWALIMGCLVLADWIDSRWHRL